MIDWTIPNLDYSDETTIKLIKSLVNKGDIINWCQPIEGDTFKDNKGKFRVTSVSIKSWGSIYINLRVMKGRYFNRDLSKYLTGNSTEYRNKKEREEFKYCTLKKLMHQQLKLVGYHRHNIFIKRLYI
jgi:hypothetical protein